MWLHLELWLELELVGLVIGLWVRWCPRMGGTGGAANQCRRELHPQPPFLRLRGRALRRIL